MSDGVEEFDWTLGIADTEPKSRPYTKADALESRMKRAIEVLQPSAENPDVEIAGPAKEAISILKAGLRL